MDLIVYLLAIAFGGLVLGGLARLALPGPDPMSITQTILVGMAGSFAGGLISWALFGRGAGSLFISFVCSFAIVYAIRRSRGGTLTEPGSGALRR
jgi:uncharacterized membrane protein YeaQ/YmgE (transglycosylase-associated protein family)